MNSVKLTLVFASLALVLAFAANSFAATTATNPQTISSWCGGGQSGSHGPHGYGQGCGR